MNNTIYERLLMDRASALHEYNYDKFIITDFFPFVKQIALYFLNFTL